MMITNPGGFYKLGRNNKPVPARADEWARSDRVVCRQYVNGNLVSTVFLGIDHAFGEGPPVLWETMIFWEGDDSDRDEYQERYTSHDDAIAGHEQAVEFAKGQGDDNQ